MTSTYACANFQKPCKNMSMSVADVENAPFRHLIKVDSVKMPDKSSFLLSIFLRKNMPKGHTPKVLNFVFFHRVQNIFNPEEWIRQRTRKCIERTKVANKNSVNNLSWSPIQHVKTTKKIVRNIIPSRNEFSTVFSIASLLATGVRYGFLETDA